MSSLVLWSSKQWAGLPTAGRQRASNAGWRAAVDNPCAKLARFKAGLVCFSMPAIRKTTSRSAFSDTHHGWQVAVSGGGTCTRGLRIASPNVRRLPLWLRVCGCACAQQRILRVCRPTGSLYCLRRTQAGMSLMLNVSLWGIRRDYIHPTIYGLCRH